MPQSNAGQPSRPGSSSTPNRSSNQTPTGKKPDAGQPQLRTRYGSIHEAVKAGDTVELERMVKEGASVNEVDEKEKFTPLHWAAYIGGTRGMQFC